MMGIKSLNKSELQEYTTKLQQSNEGMALALAKAKGERDELFHMLEMSLEEKDELKVEIDLLKRILKSGNGNKIPTKCRHCKKRRKKLRERNHVRL